MAKIKRLLTELLVRTETEPGKYYDRYGMFLQIFASGAKCFQQRYTFKGKRRTIGLGGHLKVSLKKARTRAMENYILLGQGIDPYVEKHKLSVPTFETAARAACKHYSRSWTNDREEHDWIRSLETHAFKPLGNRSVSEIGISDVVTALEPIWHEKPVAARKVRQRIGAVMKWCIGKGYCTTSPVGDALDAALGPNTSTKNFRAVPHAQAACVIAAVHTSGRSVLVKLAFEFLVLTGVRTMEALGARWSEFDFETNTWAVPAARMKMRRLHRVPLSFRALAVLRAARALSGDHPSGLVFPSRSDRVMVKTVFSRLLRELKVEGVPHGFRSCFRSWAGDTGVPWEVAEACLAHSKRDPYARSDLFKLRRPVMEEWAQYLQETAPSSNEPSPPRIENASNPAKRRRYTRKAAGKRPS